MKLKIFLTLVKINSKKMEITMKDLEKNLKTLPKELLGNVNDYIDFLKKKYISKESKNSSKQETFKLTENHKKILDSQENLDDSEFQDHDEFLAELEKEYDL
ncbi:hypothetical protein J4771_02935 [Candidatus Kaistella beijingensis]|uniref:DUF2281 domain-containing protein n=1 Tax=Candidatus Kaistella beijingensis TaxID=2820270 RepID=UPI001CC7B99E|nr:DUF2281 domain-containing protein [Candidatus Kaistella beijingensis]UBB90328.1 hypothetical protein J4771_02935 [Candidatus Kaistella beijingensis]